MTSERRNPRTSVPRAKTEKDRIGPRAFNQRIEFWKRQGFLPEEAVRISNTKLFNIRGTRSDSQKFAQRSLKTQRREILEHLINLNLTPREIFTIIKGIVEEKYEFLSESQIITLTIRSGYDPIVESIEEEIGSRTPNTTTARRLVREIQEEEDPFLENQEDATEWLQQASQGLRLKDLNPTQND